MRKTVNQLGLFSSVLLALTTVLIGCGHDHRRPMEEVIVPVNNPGPMMLGGPGYPGPQGPIGPMGGPGFPPPQLLPPPQLPPPQFGY